MSGLLDLSALISTPIRILDIGAMPIANEQSCYDNLIDKALCEIVAFDALDVACQQFERRYQNRARIRCYNRVIADGSQHTFYVCAHRSRSSIYEPNMSVCGRYSDFAEYMEVVDTQPVQTTRLDDLPEIGDIDWAKLDVQGAELLAIQGGANTLQQATVIEIEAEFIEQYKNQPLFADVDQALRNLGFAFHTFLGFGTRPLKPLLQSDKRQGFRQWLWADAVYIKDFHYRKSLEDEKLVKMATIMHHVYDSYDTSCSLFSSYDKRHSTRVSESYTTFLHEHRLVQ